MPKVSLLALPLACAVLLLGGCSSAPAKTEPKSDATQAEIGDLRNQVLSLSSHIQSLETKLQSINDKMDKDLTTYDNAMGVQKPKTGSVGGKPSDDAGLDIVPTRAKSDPESGFEMDQPIQLFRKAMILFEAGRFPDAILAFSSFVEKYPDHVLAGSAQFYVGESYYSEKENRLALQEFERVLTTYDRSPHVPETLEHMAEIESKLKMTESAARHRHLLTSLFPQSPAAADLKTKPHEEVASMPTAPAATPLSPSAQASAAPAPMAAAISNSGPHLDEPPPTAPMPAMSPANSNAPMSPNSASTVLQPPGSGKVAE
jgi:tol-pal system protein YbgF